MNSKVIEKDNQYYVLQNENEVYCPVCGSRMLLRTARKGRYAGSTFWGCGKYPFCKTIVNITDDMSYNPSSKKNEAQSNDLYVNHYRRLHARPYNENFDAVFFQSCAFPQKIFKDLLNNKVQQDTLKIYSKFRVDYSGGLSYPTNIQKQIYSICIRFLNRGSITTNSVNVETSLLKKFKANNAFYNFDCSFLNDYVVYENPINTFDSNNEKRFFDSILRKAFGENWASIVLPQVSIESIVDEYDNVERVDFLVFDGVNNFIIELDGEEHSNHINKDELRDSKLTKAGYTVIRIPNKEIDDVQYCLNKYFQSAICFKYKEKTEFEKYLIASKMVHQIQIAVVKGLELGYLNLKSILNFHISTKDFSDDELDFIFDLALKDLGELYSNFAKVYGIDEKYSLVFDKNSTNNICFGNTFNTSNEIIIRNLLFKDNILCEIGAFVSLQIKEYSEELLKYFLTYLFRFNSFQEGQYDAIVRLLEKKDSIILLPTGSGKSLIYQLSSLIVPGLTIVISPIISLMEDQINNLFYFGIDNAFTINSARIMSNSGLDIGVIRNNNFSLIYISPERLQMISFRNAISEMLISNTINTVAIDEAHCVSEWGHDFRTSYLNIGKNARELFKKYGEVPVVLALTGTASTSVLKDVQRELQIKDYSAIITPKTFDRPELSFDIFESSSDNKIKILETLLNNELPSRFNVSFNKFSLVNEDDTYCGIVFCPHTNGDFGVVGVANYLTKTSFKVGKYSGSTPKGYKSDYAYALEKKETTDKFKTNKLNLLVATKAFGMGIDKANIRYTVHYGIPGSIESFYQEVGRAGRDKKYANCSIIYSNDDVRINNTLLAASTPLSSIRKSIDDLSVENKDDISRMLYFHTKSFSGIEIELEHINNVLKKIFFDDNNLAKRQFNIVAKNEEERVSLEKAIHRLVILGVLGDYTINFASKEFEMRLGDVNFDSIKNNYAEYVRGYNEGRVKIEKEKLDKHKNEVLTTFILSASKILIEFIYDTIEKGRRRGLREIVSMCQAAIESNNRSEVIRNRIIRYFESTYSEELNEILENVDNSFEKIRIIFDGDVIEGEQIGGIRSSNEASGLRGEVSRALEATPDHPGLLFLRALAECFSKTYDKEAIISDYVDAIEFALEKYEINQERLKGFIIYSLNKIFKRDNELFSQLILMIKGYFENNQILYEIIYSDIVEEGMRDIPILLIENDFISRAINKIRRIKGK